MEPKLYAAAMTGDVRVLTEWQVHDPNILQELTPTKNTAIHLAAYHGHVKFVEELLHLMNRDIQAGNQASGEFLTAKNVEGNTAFHEAAIGGHYQVIEVLLEHGGDLVNVKNGAGETALFKTVEEGHEKIVEKLLPETSSEHDSRSDGQTLVQCAVYNKHKGVLKKLIAHKPDCLQQVDNLGRTPLHNSAYVKGISQIAKILIEKDKRLCYKVDNNNQSALHIAVKEGNLELVTQILNYAKDCIEIVDTDGRNALHLAVENAVQIFHRISRRIKTLVLSVISKRLINKPDNEGKTALDIAIDKMGSDERLYNGIKRLLEINGARRTPKVTQEHLFPTKKSTWKVQIVLVNAVLIATVAFAAAFTLPKEDKKHQLYGVLLQVTVISDALALCSSISSAILLMYALYGKQEDSLLLKTSLIALWISLISLLVAFGAGICVAVAPDHKVVAKIIWAMVSIVPIFIRIMIFRSKKYIFREDEYHLWIFLILIGIQDTVPDVRLINIILVIVMIVGILGILVFIGRRRYLRSHKNISKDDGHYLWFFIWALISGIIFNIPVPLLAMGVSYLIWIVVGIGVYSCRRKYFGSKQNISRDDDHYVWFFIWYVYFNLTVGAIFYLKVDWLDW